MHISKVLFLHTRAQVGDTGVTRCAVAFDGCRHCSIPKTPKKRSTIQPVCLVVDAETPAPTGFVAPTTTCCLLVVVVVDVVVVESIACVVEGC